MNLLMLNVVLALVWALLTGSFLPGNLLAGMVVGYFILFATRRMLGPTSYFEKVPGALSFVAFYAWELVRSNLRVAADVLRSTRHLQPRIIGIPMAARTPTEVVLLALLIALTPGTLVLDISTDRHVIYIHVLAGADADQVRHEIKDGLERRLLKLMRGSKG
jgi:multicomponent Na+:H+ antiporter subunit E